ncbi:MAG: hypothetical protein GC191_00365 [Azospirillum sp.]|nr:hypothetical protein [Azospirillum sp.]
MSGLGRLQGGFKAFLWGGGDGFAESIAPGPRASVETMLGVYRHAYRARLLEALAVAFPILKEIVGDATFAQIGHGYIADQPSPYRSIRWFGDGLPRFLAEHPDWAGSPWLSELAAFEWTLGTCFDGPDATPVDVAEVAAVPPEAWPDLRLRLLPTACRLTLAWGVPQAWRAITDGAAEIPPPLRYDPPVTWLFWRPDLQSRFRSLEAGEEAALDAVIAGSCFGDFCELLSARLGPDQAALLAAGWLRRWLEDGLVAAVTV